MKKLVNESLNEFVKNNKLNEISNKKLSQAANKAFKTKGRERQGEKFSKAIVDQFKFGSKNSITLRDDEIFHTLKDISYDNDTMIFNFYGKNIKTKQNIEEFKDPLTIWYNTRHNFIEYDDSEDMYPNLQFSNRRSANNFIKAVKSLEPDAKINLNTILKAGLLQID